MAALAQLRGKIDVHYGGADFRIRTVTGCIGTTQKAPPFLPFLPVLPRRARFMPFSLDLSPLLKKRCPVNGAAVARLIRFLKSNDPLYADVPVDDALLARLGDIGQPHDAVL